ncbi:hypothetical protein J6590_088576 [Homalodisca vitripennis]|nr:hypothetical protein J6590_088576 [Homalodisca vitripennis]
MSVMVEHGNPHYTTIWELFGFGSLELRRKVASLMFLYKLVRGVVDDPASLAEQPSVLGSILPHDGSCFLAALPGDEAVQFYTELRV